MPALAAEIAEELAVTERADTQPRSKTTHAEDCRQLQAAAFESLLHRPDEAQSVNEDELKILAQVLTEKYSEFDVHGQVTQINPGPVVTTFEFKPEAGIKYSRITGLTDDLCLALRAESILIERMPGKSTVGIQVPNREREIIWLRENIESPGISGLEIQAHAGHRQGHQRPPRRRRSGRHAAPADRRFDRHRQERGHQRLDHVHPLQGDARPGAPGAGRSQAPGTRQLRRRSASLHADHHRAEAGGQCAAQRRPRNGTPPEAAGSERRAQHRSVQPAVRRHAQPVRTIRPAKTAPCPTSSSSSTNWPT